ncbi:MAG: hypothetical protein ACOCZ5_01260 [bacterium]
MKLTRREVVDMFVCLKEMDNKVKANKWFSYTKMVNEDELENKAKAIIEISKPKKEYLDYMKDRTDILNKYGDRDDDGNIITLNDSVKIDKNKVKDCQKELNDLDNRYKEVIEDRNKNLEEYYNLLDTEIDINIETVPFEYVPETISVQDLKSLKKMIVMPSKEEEVKEK